MGRWPNLEQKQIIFNELGYKPHSEQLLVHQSGAEVVQIVGAEGAGKSFVTAAEIAAMILFSDLVYLVGEKYINAKPEFDYLKQNLIGLELLDAHKVKQEDSGKATLLTETGCRVDTISARDGAAAIIAKGESPDLIVLCEAGVISSFSVATAAVRRVTRARGRCVMVGTLRDSFGWYAGLADEFQAEGNAWRGETFSLPAWSNLNLYPGGRNDPEILRLERILSEDEFARTVAARKVPSRALVFPEFRWSVHARPCPFDPDLPVYLAIDPGYYPSAYFVGAFQFHGDEAWQIDEIYENFLTHKQIITIARDRFWWSKVDPYNNVIDIAGRGHAASDSAIEVWSGEAGIYLHSQKVGVQDGISRHRDFLQGDIGPDGERHPRLYHDSERCRSSLNEYGQYKKPTDKDGNVIGDDPKDEHNHAAKGIAYFLVHHFGLSDKSRKIVSVTVPRASLRAGIEAGGYS